MKQTGRPGLSRARTQAARRGSSDSPALGNLGLPTETDQRGRRLRHGGNEPSKAALREAGGLGQELGRAQSRQQTAGLREGSLLFRRAELKEGDAQLLAPCPKDTHTILPLGHGSGGDPQRGEEAHIALGILKLGKGTEVTTCFSDMSTAVNRAEGDFLDLEGGLGPSLVGEHVPSPFVSPRAEGQGSWAAARTMCSPQGRQVSCGLGHSTQRHIHTLVRSLGPGH